ncbi:MAG: DUF2080 family transposase-associated protein [Nanoarchaeota archaeon]
MIIENIFEQQERVVRKVNLTGNGAHTFVPKEWAGEEVLIVRISKLDIKKEVLKVLEPFMENIICVILFGSYARGEQSKKSDIDVLIISNKQLKLKQKGMDIIIITEDKIKKAIDLNPILIYSAISEGVPLVNSFYFEKLKKEKVKPELFKEFYRSTKLSLKSDKEILELDKEQNLNYISNSVIYSLFLRLRGAYIIKRILKGEKYSNRKYKKWLMSNVPDLDYSSFYSIYASIRDKRSAVDKIDIKVGESLIDLLSGEIRV